MANPTPSPKHVAKLMSQGFTLPEITTAYKIREILHATTNACPITAVCYLMRSYPEILDDPECSARFLGTVIGVYGTLRMRAQLLAGIKEKRPNISLSEAVTKLILDCPSS